jgi:hypothetical protein
VARKSAKSEYIETVSASGIFPIKNT